MQADSETLLRREVPDTSLKRLLRLSGPVVISLMAQNLIGVIDTAFLGRLGVIELGGASIAALVYFSIFTVASASPPAHRSSSVTSMAPGSTARSVTSSAIAS